MLKTTLGPMSEARALLFDLDGTISDTDVFHHQAFNKVMEQFGRRIDSAEFEENISGKSNPQIMEFLVPHLSRPERDRLADMKEVIYRTLARESLVAREGLSDLLKWSRVQGLRSAVVTNAPRLNAELVLDKLGLLDSFDEIVIADELGIGKPHPLPYLTALERLSVTAPNALAFEDSLSGIASARAAGIKTLAVRTAIPQDKVVKAGAVHCIVDFTDLELIPFITGHLLLESVGT